MKPTPRASALAQSVLSVMGTIRSDLLVSTRFDAAKAKRVFSLYDRYGRTGLSAAADKRKSTAGAQLFDPDGAVAAEADIRSTRIPEISIWQLDRYMPSRRAYSSSSFSPIPSSPSSIAAIDVLGRN